ncbi:MAG: PQQ-binding-like beta-propeller repeat protein [Planctomycetaceae bacterium]
MAEDTAINASLADEMDWPYWRGPEMNGISREKGLVDSWSPDGKNLIFRQEALAGFSSPIVMKGKLYMTARNLPETEKEGEKVICADAATGKVLWEYPFNVYLSDVPDTRVAWSSCVGDPTTGNVYALGVCNYFVCLNGETGEKIWDCSLGEEYGALNTYGGRTNFPVIHGNLVIISAVITGWGDMAKPCHRLIAFDKRNGLPVWFNGTRLFPYDTTYSSPTTTVVDGKPMLIFGSGDGGVHAFQPETGKPIWSLDMARRGVDPSPLVVGNTVYAAHGEENATGNVMGALVAIDATKTGKLTQADARWAVPGHEIGKSSPLMVDGKLITIENSARLNVVNPENGEIIASKKLGTIMFGSPVYADGKIYTCELNGRWYILKLNGNKVETVHQLRLGDDKIYGSPIISHGRIYLRTSEAMYCIGDESRQPSADPRPPAPTEAAIEKDPAPAQVQVVPVESLLLPGKGRQYQVLLYNSRGQFLKMADAGDVQFSLEGAGQIDAKGKYEAPADDHQPATASVTAKVGKLAGKARIRVVPDLPLEFDFHDGEVPLTWVGARYRHLVIDFDLYETLRKADPRAAELYIYFRTDFINNERSTSTFDDTVPARPQWTPLLRYLRLGDDPKIVNTLDGAKAALDPALQRLKDERVLQGWEWSTADGAGNRLVVHRGDRKLEGNGVMVKIRTIPLGTRSHAWMGHTFYHDYTIQADVMANTIAGKVPDIGLIGQRYVIDLMGAYEQLQIRTWHAQARMAKATPIKWQPHVWYTLKLQSSIEDGKAVLKGKVWPRDEAEPADWLVEAVDESPNLNGSPGLFGDASKAEIFYDNIKITYNSPSKS